MPLDSVIVGYADSERATLHRLWEDYGHRALPCGNCISCGVRVHFVQSGRDAIRTRDPKIICNRCRNDPVIWAQVYAEL